MNILTNDNAVVSYRTSYERELLAIKEALNDKTKKLRLYNNCFVEIIDGNNVDVCNGINEEVLKTMVNYNIKIDKNGYISL